MTKDDIRKIIMDMKPCLNPSHIACEKCQPGFNARMERRLQEEREKFEKLAAEIYNS